MWLCLLVLNISSFELVKDHMHNNSILWWHKKHYTYFCSLFYPACRSTAIPDQCHKLHPLSCAWSLVLLGSVLYFMYTWYCVHHFLEPGKESLTWHLSIVVPCTTKFCFYLSSLADFIVILLSDLWCDSKTQLTSDTIAVGSIHV